MAESARREHDRETHMRQRLPGAVLLLPACFVIEVILGGPFGIYGGVSVRFVLLGASCGILLFALLVRGRIADSHLLPIMSIVGFLLLNGIWIAFVPVLTGTNMHWSLREGHSFIVIVPVVLLLALLRRPQLARVSAGLQRVVVGTSIVLAIFQVGLWVLGTLFEEMRWAVPLVLGSIFAGASDQLFVGPTADGFFRVFWISTLWCLLGFFWVPAALPGSRLRWLARGLLLLDLFVAYSRGIWVGLLAGSVVVAAVTWRRHRLATLRARSLVVGGLAGAALVGILAATGTLTRGVSRFRSTASREDASISARIEQAPFLLQLWYEHPVVGSGYGAYSKGHLRSQEAPYSYEHMPYALLAKLGLMGVLVSSSFFAGWAFTAWRARRRAPGQAASFLGSCTALLIAEMTNPMALNFVSMSIFACLLIQWADLVSDPEPSPAC
jgi:O-antigen ligase